MHGRSASGRLAVIGGHSILGSAYAADAAEITSLGVALLDAGTHVVAQRHGFGDYTPAHLVRHSDNLRALAALGCTRVLAFSSVGGLRPEMGVGTFLVPDDFIALGATPSTFTDGRGHIVPGFDPEWRAAVVDGWSHVVSGVALRDGGTYWQTVGPRFETRAEIGFIARFADVVGMTAASECVAARELGLAYAVVCVVDNLANGIGDEALTIEEFEAGKAANRAAVLAALDAVVPELV